MRTFAMILGYLGMGCTILSFQFKKERSLFFLLCLGGLLFTLHYGFLGEYTGMAMDAVVFLRTLMLYSEKKPLVSWPMAGLLCAVQIALCILTWSAWYSILPCIALVGSTLALYSQNGNIIRYVQFLCTSPCWLIYNIRVGSIPGAVCEVLTLISIVVYFARVGLGKNKKEEQSEAGTHMPYL